MLIATPRLGRRRFAAAGLAAGAALALPTTARAQPAPRNLRPTPPQTVGPFYPTSFPADADNDLVSVRGAEAQAIGTVAHLVGRVLGLDGKPVGGAQVEIWQCDAYGRYLHPSSGLRDTAFQGFGRTVTGPDGSYRFRTIRPAAYPGRTPHIHVAVTAPGRRDLATQVYVAGEPGNERDYLYRSLGAQRDLVTVVLQPANGIEPGALAGQFDIVM